MFRKFTFIFILVLKKNGNQTCCLYNWICSLANAQHYRLYFEKSSNMAKNEEKSWFNMPSTHFSTICVLNLPYIIYIIKKYPPQLYGIKNSDFFFFQFHATRAGRKYIFEIIVMNKLWLKNWIFAIMSREFFVIIMRYVLMYGICTFRKYGRRNFTRVNPKMQSKLSTPNELLSLTHVIQPKLM